MTKRRLAMEKLLAGEDVETLPAGEEVETLPPTEEEVATAPPSRRGPPSRAGAVHSMALALGRLHAPPPVADGEVSRVVELDPLLCDPSFVRDRIEDEADDGIEELARSIAEGGQAVPILVRHNPADPARYQIAYGHRRWRACGKLGRPVRAIVGALADDELALAQGHENNARRDLTFIERAQFADALVGRGFSRALAGKALGVDKSELARLLQVAGGLPADLVAAIGRAPKAGRPRWLKLVALCAEGRAQVAFTAVESVRERPSDVRFAAAMQALSARAAPEPAAPVPATVKVGRRQATVTIDETAAPGFGRFVEGRLATLFREFSARR